MLFGRGSTGGVVNQVSKHAAPRQRQRGDRRRSASGSYLRSTGDFNLQDLGETSALRLNVMTTHGRQLRQHDRQVRHRADLPLRASARADEFSLGYYYLREPQRHQLRHPVAAPRRRRPISATNPARPGDDRPEELLRRGERLQRRLRRRTARFEHTHRFGDGGQWHTVVAQRRLRPRPARLDDPLLRAHGQRDDRRGHQPGLPGGRADAVDDQRRDAARRAAPTTRCRT